MMESALGLVRTKVWGPGGSRNDRAKAGKDLPLLNDSIDAFAGRARELGNNLEVVTHPAGVHGFDTLNDDDTTRMIIRRTVDFIGAHLRG